MDQNGVPWRENLATGTSASEVETRLRAVGLAPSDELTVLLGWRNGARPTLAGPQILPRFPMASLDQQIDRYESTLRRGWSRITGERESAWGAGAGWLRLTTDNYGLAAECKGIVGREQRIRYTTPDFGEPETKHLYKAVSLSTYFAWMILGVESGQFTWNAEMQHWDEDWELAPQSRKDALFG